MTETPLPWTETPLDREAPGQRPPVNRMTHRCKNITLPQTSFEVDKYFCLDFKQEKVPYKLNLVNLYLITDSKIRTYKAVILFLGDSGNL